MYHRGILRILLGAGPRSDLDYGGHIPRMLEERFGCRAFWPSPSPGGLYEWALGQGRMGLTVALRIEMMHGLFLYVRMSLSMTRSEYPRE